MRSRVAGRTLGRSSSAVAVALVACFTVATPAAAASASSWRTSIAGEHLRGGATTLLTSDGRGSVNVRFTGVAAGQPVAVSINVASCPTVGASLFSFLTSPASSAGTAIGKGWLSPAQVTAYNAALTARTPLSVLAFAAGDTAVPIATITIPWRALLPVLDRTSPIARLLPR